MQIPVRVNYRLRLFAPSDRVHLRLCGDRDHRRNYCDA
jgi:hypothetical protein